MRPPVDVVATVVVVGADVVSAIACPRHVPTFPTLSTAASSTLCEQQEALKVTIVMFSPAAPATMLVLMVPFPSRMMILSMPVPLMPSVRLAMNCHWVEAHSEEEAGQIPVILITWHTGPAKSVTWKQKKRGDYTIREECGGKKWKRTGTKSGLLPQADMSSILTFVVHTVTEEVFRSFTDKSTNTTL